MLRFYASIRQDGADAMGHRKCQAGESALSRSRIGTTETWMTNHGRAAQLRLTDEQSAEVKRRLADPNPKFLTLEEVRERFAERLHKGESGS